MSTREKVTRVFQFLKAFTDLRTPVVRDVRHHDWTYDLADLPAHATVHLDFQADEAETTSFRLTVGRPILEECPRPPEIILGWVSGDWRNSSRQVSFEPSRTIGGVSEDFAADTDRVRAADHWTIARDEWAERDRPARAADKLFQKLFDIRSRFEREGEKIELIAGDGFLNWRHAEGSIDHPLVLRRLQLNFDPAKPEFTIEPTAAPAELYLPLLRNLTGVEGEVVAKLVADFDKRDVEPFGGKATEIFLRSTAARLGPHGQFLHSPPTDEQSYPRIFRSNWLVLRRRTGGFQAAIEAILENLASEDNELPDSLARLVGDAEALPVVSPDEVSGAALIAEDAPDILFSKHSNPEQMAIAERLERFGSVLVQGPPGTGKTYTIGNLISHLLAQKKTVLVTSHSTKALRLVRHNVTPMLRPLVVSVLDRDTDSQKELEFSVATISEKLSRTTADSLRKEAETLLRRRGQVAAECERAERALLRARTDEYRDIIVGGQAHSPSDAARFVAGGESEHGWIPTPVTPGAICPLTRAEVAEMYALNRTIPDHVCRELDLPLPSPSQFPDADAFASLVASARAASAADVSYDPSKWEEVGASSDAVSLVLAQLSVWSSSCSSTNAFDVELIDAGRRGGAYRAAWDDLLADVADLVKRAAEAAVLLSRYGPAISEEASNIDLESAAREVVQHVEKNGGVKWWARFVSSKWRHVLRTATVNGRAPVSAEEFRSVLVWLELARDRAAVVSRWNRTVAPFGGTVVAADTPQPERVLEVCAREATRLLEWHEAVWRQQVLPALRAIGFVAQASLLCREPSSAYSDILSLLSVLSDDIPVEVEKRLNQLRLREADEAVQRIVRAIHESGCADRSVLLSNLERAVAARDVRAYGAAVTDLRSVLSLREKHARRRELIDRLRSVAPAWAEAVDAYLPRHADGTTPSDPDAAWLWKQLDDELRQRSAVSLDELNLNLERLRQELQSATTAAVDACAWLGRHERTDHAAQQALHGWTQVIRKIGAGTGKRVDVLRREAQRLMTACQHAVPVWVMPLSRVVESFDPRTTKFDVVIVDESSQLDVVGMIALYMGRQAVVVGDKEQVSPDAVGIRLDDVQKLIDTMLIGVPNSVLYDGQTSIYDLAESAFGGAIGLKEHFRCVPDIIGFSNRLAYGGTIRPLRATSSARVLPSTVSYRVENSYSDRPKTNSEEVDAVAALIVAATRRREYDGLSFGVLSLVGEEQAALIERRLREVLSPGEIERRHLLCGNAAQFQGDERDVMFLSVVDKPQDGPLAFRQDKRFRQRFNVAASRARDQMWVVHSLRHEVDLKPDDLRRALIEHANNPQSFAHEVASVIARTESPFEARMAEALVTRGYNVKPQVEVGYYRLDMVVSCAGRAVAIECDGDRFHSGDQLLADMARQAVLERLGWRFIRVRGSEFFRNEQAAVGRVVSELNRMRIYPSSPSEAAPSYSSNEVLRAVISEAEALRKEWHSERALGMDVDEAHDSSPLYGPSSSEIAM